jgi:hypothetical protein
MWTSEIAGDPGPGNSCVVLPEGWLVGHPNLTFQHARYKTHLAESTRQAAGAGLWAGLPPSPHINK